MSTPEVDKHEKIMSGAHDVRGVSSQSLWRKGKVQPFVSSFKKVSVQSAYRESSNLVSFYQSMALTESTKKSYLRGWCQFSNWANEFSRKTSIPLVIIDIHQLLSSSAASTGSWPKVNLARRGIKYQYRLQNV